SIGLFHP
ncbi:hypothetical protein ECFDA507_3205, partial [Escherichia coli FDA507]